MGTASLWEHYRHWQKNCRWVDLTRPLSPLTPHWVGWEPLKIETKADLESSLFLAHAYTTVGQYGTHLDAPNHMVKGGRDLSQIDIHELVMPLCIIDQSEAVRTNADYSLCIKDILAFEAQHGKIPAGAFVAFQSNWSKRPAAEMDNLDAQGKRHFPGWSLEALKFLVSERNIGGIGHETSDTEAPICSEFSNYEVEHYILAQNRIHAELLRDLDQCPATGAIIFCIVPKLVGGSGFPARCFALCPQN